MLGDGFGTHADAEEGLEGGLAGLAAIEAEDELVDVRLKVLRPQAVVDPEHPGLKVGAGSDIE